MNASPNIYHAVVFHLHPKIKELLNQLDLDGQIDHDEMNAPHLISADPIEASTFRCVFMRNGKPEHFVLHTRKKVEPIQSWGKDGYKRADKPDSEEPSRKERQRRSVNAYESIMEQILPRRR